VRKVRCSAGVASIARRSSMPIGSMRGALVLLRGTAILSPDMLASAQSELLVQADPLRNHRCRRPADLARLSGAGTASSCNPIFCCGQGRDETERTREPRE
jgi:hypothetical protein